MNNPDNLNNYYAIIFYLKLLGITTITLFSCYWLLLVVFGFNALISKQPVVKILNYIHFLIH